MACCVACCVSLLTNLSTANNGCCDLSHISSYLGYPGLSRSALSRPPNKSVRTHSIRKLRCCMTKEEQQETGRKHKFAISHGWSWAETVARSRAWAGATKRAQCSLFGYPSGISAELPAVLRKGLPRRACRAALHLTLHHPDSTCIGHLLHEMGVRWSRLHVTGL